MESTMEIVMRCLFLSLLSGVSVLTFFDTLVPRKKLRRKWLEHTVIMAYAAGYMVIAFTEIPPYILQPVRLVLVIAVVSQCYFQMGVVKNLMLSVVYGGIYWVTSMLFFAVVSVTPLFDHGPAVHLVEPILEVVFFCLMAAFRYCYQRRGRGMEDVKWGKFGLLSLTGIIVSLSIGMMSVEDAAENYYARLAIIAGFFVAYVFCFYYMAGVFEKEAQMQKLRLLHEHTQNQMKLYQSMQERFEQQRRYQHDYKNQLTCIRGMLENGQTEETLAYISELTGSLKQNEMSVNTNHSVVNVMLNRKYQEACDREIVMTMAANDLSELTISAEDIVTLLGNLLDNAIEACERLGENRIIQFKMMLEEGQLILSVRNPVDHPLRIRDNRIVTSKKDKSMHGIGLLNVDSVIRKNQGMSVLKCENGWFSFTAMIPSGE